MISEFCERVLAEVSKISSWPHIDDVRKAMEKVTAEMEADALANPIVPKTESALTPMIQEELAAVGIEPVKTPLDDASEPEPVKSPEELQEQADAADHEEPEVPVAAHTEEPGDFA